MACLIRVVGPVHRSERKTIVIDTGCDSDKTLAQPEELSMEEAITLVLNEEAIELDTWSTTKNGKYFKVEFSVIGEEKLERILDRLAFYNFGKTEDSSIMVIEPTAFVFKRVRPQKSGTISHVAFQSFLRSLKSRLCVAQVYNEINRRGTFDMNYLCFLICAAVVADVALVTNSAGVVFASMLLSPLMDPIVCILFGLNLREGHMIIKGIRNTAISLILCVALGFSFGYVAHSVGNFEQVTPFPTQEMKSRGQVKSFLSSMLVASFSGVSVAFATLSRRVAALIGNAISLSLLPPAVNCGQLLLLSILSLSPVIEEQPLHSDNANVNGSSAMPVVPRCSYPWIRNYDFIYVDDPCAATKEMLMLGAFSFLLVTMNILLILVTGYTVNTLKDLAPKAFTNETIRRFYQKDLPEVRTKYDCLHKLDATNLAVCAYKEYLRLNQINPETDELSVEEKQRIASDFRAVLQGLEQDQYLRTMSVKAGQTDCSFLQTFVKQSKRLASDNFPRTQRSSLPEVFYGVGDANRQGKHRSHHYTVAAQHDALNHVVLGPNRSIRSLNVQNTVIGGGAARARFERLERLGEVDYENSEHQAALVLTKPSLAMIFDGENQHQANNMGKFHVVPTQLSLDQHISAYEDDMIDRV